MGLSKCGERYKLFGTYHFVFGAVLTFFRYDLILPRGPSGLATVQTESQSGLALTQLSTSALMLVRKHGLGCLRLSSTLTNGD